jgi:hypothetical protein
VILEKLSLIVQRRRNRFIGIDIPLSTIDNGHITELEGDNPSSQDIHHVRALIHQIHFGQDTNRPCSLGVGLSGHLQPVGIGKIGVGRSDSEDDGVGFGNVSHQHVSNLLFDISRLISDGYFGQTGQIDQGEGEDVGGEDSQVDWVWRYTLTIRQTLLKTDRDLPAFFPVIFSVSRTISSLILLKSWNFCPGKWRNSPHSSALSSFSVDLATASSIQSAHALSFGYRAYQASRPCYHWALRGRHGGSIAGLEVDA